MVRRRRRTGRTSRVTRNGSRRRCRRCSWRVVCLVGGLCRLRCCRSRWSMRGMGCNLNCRSRCDRRWGVGLRLGAPFFVVRVARAGRPSRVFPTYLVGCLCVKGVFRSVVVVPIRLPSCRARVSLRGVCVPFLGGFGALSRSLLRRGGWVGGGGRATGRAGLRAPGLSGRPRAVPEAGCAPGFSAGRGFLTSGAS